MNNGLKIWLYAKKLVTNIFRDTRGVLGIWKYKPLEPDFWNISFRSNEILGWLIYNQATFHIPQGAGSYQNKFLEACT